MFTVKNVVITIASIALIGFGISAFAYSGMGWGGGWGHHGPGWHHGGYGPSYGDELSQEEYRQFEQKREAFFEETRGLRESLFEKERALQDELSQSDPDAAKASRLQKKISDLQAELDQKRVDHMIEMRKLNPNIGRGFMPGGPMMGYDYGGGYCWR
jgi:Spy/CpxP family protein refolding chaperone